jgi:TolB-like protein/class 3 adenylate cyclase/Flp pilus assembly protein TadD
MRRRLIAILFADIVGYSELCRRDESGTRTEYNRRLRVWIRPAILRCRGRLIAEAGDSLLVEFDSAVNAVGCACAIQEKMIADNLDMPAESQLHFRVGVHLGEVIVEGKGIQGEHVNLAERIQSVADPDGILVSQTVYDQVKGKLSLTFRDLGERQAKDIAVRVYGVGNAAGPPLSSPRPSASFKPVVAVLPFLNLSTDPEQQYFGDGVAEDLLTALSRFRTLSVISRNSSFLYRDKNLDVKDIGRELGAQYVIEGSIRKLGSRVRITAQLINTDSRHHVWAENYDADMTDLFAVQDNVTRRVAAAIVPHIEREELEVARHRPTQSHRAYDCFLRGKAAFYAAHDGASIEEARQHFEEARSIDPQFAGAYLWLARIDNTLTIYSRAGMPLTALREQAWGYVQKAAALDDKDARIQLNLAWCHLWRGQFEAARRHCDMIGQLNPNDPDLAIDRGTTLVCLGEPEAAIQVMTEGIRLNPLHPDSHLADLAEAYFMAGRYDEMIAIADRIFPDPSRRFAAWKAAGYALAGHREKAAEEARRFVDSVRAIWAGDPDAGVDGYVDWLLSFYPLRRKQDRDHLLAGLRLAGLEIRE